MNGMERRPAKRTLADVAVCRSIIKSMSTEGTPIGLPRMAFQSAFLSTESNAAFRSTNALATQRYIALYSKFPSAESASERIFKIDKVLTKLLPKVWWLPFLGHSAEGVTMPSLMAARRVGRNSSPMFRRL